MEIMKEELNNCNWNGVDESLTRLKDYVRNATVMGDPAHEVEKGVLTKVLQLGQQMLSYFFKAQGDGDVGETLTLDNGEKARRLDKGSRYYQSIFGEFKLERYRYGTREGQKVISVPLDARLSLPESDYSYLLQELAQGIAIEVPFEKTVALLGRIFPVNIPVDSLERNTRAQATLVDEFRSVQRVDVETEGALLVGSADGKGIPIRHDREESCIEEHKHNKGPKPDRKRMAVVGAVYTVDPYKRTPEQVVKALFTKPGKRPKNAPKRPLPKNKQVVAHLTREVDGKIRNATQVSFQWLAEQVRERDLLKMKPQIMLMDGQPSLWEESHRQLGEGTATEILDLLHVTSRLWDAANIFHPEDKEQQIPFMKDRVLRVLRGESKSVISGLRQMATKQGISRNPKKTLDQVCGYLEKNQHRMRYNEYLRKGYPIASGVIEGACRHFVKDRMERAGMRWSVEGAQAMLDIRSTCLNGDWDEFTKYRIKKETERLYPYQSNIKKIVWPLAA